MQQLTAGGYQAEGNGAAHKTRRVPMEEGQLDLVVATGGKACGDGVSGQRCPRGDNFFAALLDGVAPQEVRRDAD